MREVIKYIINNWVVILPSTILVIVLPFILSKYFPNNPTLSAIKQAFKVALTNRVNLLSIFVLTYVVSVISGVVNNNLSIGQSLFGSLYSVLGYGMMFWIGFILLITVLDVLLFGFVQRTEYVNAKLIFEWVVISSPFVYWLIKYNQWVFLAAIVAFLIGQLIRKPMILKILME